MRPRLSPSFIIAVLALVLASGGVGYAAATIGSAQIKDSSVQSRDIKNRTLTSVDVRKKSLGRAVLDKRCKPGEVVAFGGCIRKASSGPGSYAAAVVDCTKRGGRLPTLGELSWVASHAGYAWADGNMAQYEFSSDHPADFPVRPAALDRNLNLIGDASANSFWHHCLTY